MVTDVAGNTSAPLVVNYRVDNVSPQLQVNVVPPAQVVLSDDLAPLLGKRSDEVFDVLGTMPNEMLSLLSTPQGWTTLATYVAGRFDLPAPAYAPKLH